MKFRFLLFDLDGTLFDYDAAESNALQNTFIDLGYEYHSLYLETYRSINHGLWKDFEAGKIKQDKLKIKRFEDLAHVLKMDFDEATFSSRYLKNLSMGTSLIDGAEKITKSCSGKAELVLITNGLTEVQKPRIKKSSIGHYFNHVIISEEIGFAKPDKGIFEYTFRQLGNPPKKDVIIIGDSLSSDIAGGINYGIATCWFNPDKIHLNTYPRPDFEIRHLNELLSILC